MWWSSRSSSRAAPWSRRRRAYEQLAKRLDAECDVAPTDLIVSVVANGREDWSFGLGRAQFLEGEL